MSCCIRCGVMKPRQPILHDSGKTLLGVGQEYDDTKPSGWPESLRQFVEASHHSVYKLDSYPSIWQETPPSHSNKSVAEQHSSLLVSDII